MGHRLRTTNLLPQRPSELGAFVFITVMIPVTYIWEVTVVAPPLCTEPEFLLHVALGTLVLINVLGNFMGLWLVDTSSSPLTKPPQVGAGWHFCSSCEASAPPRSWHCVGCGRCVLKREHHCYFLLF